MANKKYYWLKLNKDFFDRHEVKIIEARGSEIILFYIKLMCESVSHDGELRFSEKIPYTREMLASVTNTRIDVVNSAMDLLLELGLADCEDDGTIVMTKVPDMIGSVAANDNAVRQQRYRDKQKALKTEDSNASVTERNVTSVTNSNESIEYRDKSIEIEEAEDNIHTLKEFTQGDLLQLRQYWNMQKCTQNIDSIKPLTKRYDNLKLCMSGRTKDQLIGEIMRIDGQAFFQKIAAENRPVKFDWFFNPNNFQKVIEGNYKDDYAKKSDDGYEVFTL